MKGILKPSIALMGALTYPKKNGAGVYSVSCPAGDSINAA